MNQPSRPAPAIGGKYYVVPMFPYPSGRLHMGHARNYAIADAYARNARAMGRHVLFPMGWDSFGLPAENAARQSGADPRSWTEANIASMKAQLETMDFSFHWDRELATHEPAYFKHTQAAFIQLMKSGLVYKKPAEVWWDPVDQTVLANEQVVAGKGWRSGAVAERRQMSMYWIATSGYAKELAAEPLAWSSGAKADHLAWIGVDEADGSARLHDWCVSRQRAWGTPVPAIECDACGPSPIPAADLPHLHARMGAPCACPSCGGPAIKSNETLDTFVDSAWYFLRYPEIGADNADRHPVGPAARAWSPVDLYVGGREHATMHLLYARFMSRALADAGWDIPKEPFVRYMAQGMVKARAFGAMDARGDFEWVDASRARPAAEPGCWTDENGRHLVDKGVQKMSKSRLNGVDPSDVASRHGVDAMRLFLFFAAPFEFDMEWDESAVSGCARFARRFVALGEAVALARPAAHPDADRAMDASQREFNVFAQAQYARHEGLNGLVAAIMKRTGEIHKDVAASSSARDRAYVDTCRALSPIAPSLAEQCALAIDASWTPTWDPARLIPPPRAQSRVALQFDGKLVESIPMPAGLDARQAFEFAMEASEKFRAKAEQSKAGWEEAVWVEGKALNARPGKDYAPVKAKI